MVSLKVVYLKVGLFVLTKKKDNGCSFQYFDEQFKGLDSFALESANFTYYQITKKIQPKSHKKQKNLP